MSNGRRRTYSPEISADIEAKLAALAAQLTAANEKCAEMAVSMISLKSDMRKFAVEECSWAAVEYLDSMDHGECAAILAGVQEEARREGKIEVLKDLGCTCDMRIGSPMITSHPKSCAVAILAALEAQG